eukprot:9626564-Prorocentrum_lima.AAC.1
MDKLDAQAILVPHWHSVVDDDASFCRPMGSLTLSRHFMQLLLLLLILVLLPSVPHLHRGVRHLLVEVVVIPAADPHPAAVDPVVLLVQEAEGSPVQCCLVVIRKTAGIQQKQKVVLNRNKHQEIQYASLLHI